MLFRPLGPASGLSHGTTPAISKTHTYTTGTIALPSNMVAERSTIDPRIYITNAARYTPNAKDLPQLPQWKPRLGRNDAFVKWLDALITAEADLDIDIHEMQPCINAIPSSVTHNATRQEIDYMMDLTAQAAQLWQDDSNILFDMIKASLNLDGVNLERDLLHIASFTQGKLKDGRALRSWALAFADMSTGSKQSALRNKLNTMKLTAVQGVEELEKHSREYWATWNAILGNDSSTRAGLSVFYTDWLSTLPGQSVGGQLHLIRQWLAEKIAENSPILLDADSTIDRMVAYATMIGIAPSKTFLGALHDQRASQCDFCDCYAYATRATPVITVVILHASAASTRHTTSQRANSLMVQSATSRQCARITKLTRTQQRSRRIAQTNK